MKNINSVMGFNKYYQLQEAADTLLAEKKAAKLENEKQRQEYEQLGHQKQGKEAELKQLREDYEKALEYSNDNRDRYEQLKQGRNADNVTRDRINKQKEIIKQVENKAGEYRESVPRRIFLARTNRRQNLCAVNAKLPRVRSGRRQSHRHGRASQRCFSADRFQEFLCHAWPLQALWRDSPWRVLRASSQKSHCKTTWGRLCVCCLTKNAPPAS
jgi:hypothetical protein